MLPAFSILTSLDVIHQQPTTLQRTGNNSLRFHDADRVIGSLY
jgi:hypothetical protein